MEALRAPATNGWDASGDAVLLAWGNCWQLRVTVNHLPRWFDSSQVSMGIANALNNRPVRVLGFVTAFHSIVYGVGYLSNRGGFNGALVGLSIDNVVITGVLGAVLSIVGLLLMWAYARLNPKTIRYVSYAQSLIWFFITLMYLFNGAPLLALGIGLTWAMISSYLAFAHKNRVNIMAYDQTDKAQRETLNEDRL